MSILTFPSRNQILKYSQTMPRSGKMCPHSSAPARKTRLITALKTSLVDEPYKPRGAELQSRRARKWLNAATSERSNSRVTSGNLHCLTSLYLISISSPTYLSLQTTCPPPNLSPTPSPPSRLTTSAPHRNAAPKTAPPSAPTATAATNTSASSRRSTRRWPSGTRS